MVPRENKNNAYSKFGGTNNEYYGIFRSGLLCQEHGLLILFSALWHNFLFTTSLLHGPLKNLVNNLESNMQVAY